MARPPKDRPDAETIEHRLRDEATRRVPVAKRWWPDLDEASTLLGHHRTTLWRKVTKQGWLGYRGGGDTGNPITVNPVDLLEIVDASREVTPKRKTSRRKAGN